MAKLIAGLILTMIGLMLIAVMFSPMTEIMNPVKGSNTFNCPGYVATDGTNTSYNASLVGNTNKLGCTVIDLTLPLLALAFLGVGIYTMLYGREDELTQY